MNSSQLFLKFAQKNNDFDPQNFIFAPQNQKASNFLEKFFTQNQNQENPIFSAIILGAGRSGKTHLINIFAQKYGAQIIDADKIAPQKLVSSLKSGNFYILPDIDCLNNDNFIFHTINAAFENKAFLLMSAKNLDNFTLNDLNSRLKNVISVKIENPDQDLLKILLTKEFSRRQLKLSSEKINFLAKNIAQNYDAVGKTVDSVEEFCFANKRQPQMVDLRGLVG